MKTGKVSLLVVSAAGILFAERLAPKRIQGLAQPAQMKVLTEGRPVHIRKASPPATRALYRSSSSVSITLVDSSRNGYGLIVGYTTPLSYDPDNGFIMAYRQWVPSDPTLSGYMGAAFSEDGETFATYSHLNVDDPGETMGRYPSAVGGPTYPYIVWNEYTLSGAGGGKYGGRPVYTWDQFYYGGGSFFSPALDLNNGCDPTPCDPPDNWVGSVDLATDGTTPVLNATYSQWSHSVAEDTTSSYNRWLYHSTTNTSGYFTFEDAILLFDEDDFMEGGYTSNAVIDVNDDGVGYAAVASYFRDQSPDSSHTFMIRKTTDYGATWSGEGGTGMNGTDYYYVPRSILKDRLFTDELMIEGFVDTSGDTADTVMFESPFITYEIDLKTDPSGGLHLFATVIPAGGGFVYPTIHESCGIYHFYSADPSDPNSWEAHFVGTTQISFLWDSNWHRIYPSAALSVDDPDVMYVTYMAVADTTADYFNYDVFVQRSVDGGKTWGRRYNVTMTRDTELDEVYPQLASLATNEECYLIFESPDYNTITVDPADDQADYKNRVYFATVSAEHLDVEAEVPLPERISLAQNYPNPFNPSTVIEFTLPRKSDVSLKVYDLLGNEVATLFEENADAGYHAVTWRGAERAAGVYIYRLQAGSDTRTKKMVLLR